VGHRRELSAPDEPQASRRGALLREALGARAHAIATGGASLELSLPADQAPRTRAAALLHETAWRAHAVAPSGDKPEIAAFLDGVQESRVIAYDGVVPIVRGRSAAVVRTRVDRRLLTWGDGALTDDSLYFPDADVNASLRERLHTTGFAVIDTSDETIVAEEAHPQQWLRRAVHLVGRGREALERALAESWCASDGEALLYVDGGLPSSDVVLGRARAIGVIKSHHTLYAAGAALATVMTLSTGERSSVFVVDSKWREPVASWYLRLRAPGGHDPLWGLVRVEYPLAALGSDARDADDLVDRLSRAVAAEASPLSLPDARWDTMAYGIRDCEVYLRATLGRLST